MGCSESTTSQTPLPYVANFDPKLKKKLIEILSADNVIALAQLEAKEDFPSNIELSEDETRWTIIHFCCRFDSVSCLDFLLKKCYIENVKQYIHLVNQQTSEGLTPLHLCGLWNSFKCFALLTKYGGLNLSAIDDKLRTAELVMKVNGLKAMEETVKILKERKGVITEWNYKLLHEFVDIPKLRSLQYHQQQIDLLKNKERGIEQPRDSPPSVDQGKLWELKSRLQLQSDAIYSQINVKRQKLRAEKEASLTQPKAKSQGKPLNAVQQEKFQKNEEILAFLRSLQEKENQIEKVKSEIRRAKSERIEEIFQMQTKQIDLQDPQTKDFLNQFAVQFSSFKQELSNSKSKYISAPKCPTLKYYRSGKQARGTKPNNSPAVCSQQTVIQNDISTLPKNIQERYKRAKEKGFFCDQQFPHNDRSLGANYQAKINQFPSRIWIRPTQIIGPDFVLFDGIEPEDIRQGSLGVCYFLATISAFAQYPQRVKELFPFSDTQIGFYVVRLYTNGKPNYIVLDDYFPCFSSNKQPLFAKTTGKQIWVSMIQKAWAKVIGSYFAAQSNRIRDVFDDLSGNPIISGAINTQDSIKKIIKYSIQGKMVVLASKSRGKIQGIVNYHAYSLLKTVQHKGNYIFKIRNPWGFFEWSGQYGDSSSLWTPQLRKKCQQKNGDDGIFFMNERELFQAFDSYAIQIIQPKTKYSFTEFKCKTGQRVYFKFRLTKKGMLAAKITQLYVGMILDKDSKYCYSQSFVEFGKIQENRVVFISERTGSWKADFFCEQPFSQYEAGDYFIRVTMNWLDPKYNTVVLSVICGETVNIQRVPQAEGFFLWKQLLINFMQKQSLTKIDKNISSTFYPMFAQYVGYSVINSTAESDCFKVKWTFNKKDFTNSKIIFNKLTENAAEFIVSKKNKDNITAYTKIQFLTYCGYTSYQIQCKKAQMPKDNPNQLQLQMQQQQEQQQLRKKLQQQQYKQQYKLQTEGEKKQIQLQAQKKIIPQRQKEKPKKKEQTNKIVQKQDAVPDQMKQLPENIKQKYLAARQKGVFQDQEFPPQVSSIGSESQQEKIQELCDSIQWLRPSQFLDNDFTLFDSINPDDIRQGQIDTSYCLAALSNYARNPEKITDIFAFHDIKIGFYVLRFYTNGKLNYVVVDDYFPCDSSKKPLFSLPVENKIWVILVEKAWAKILGSFLAAEGLNADPFMQDLTGAPTYGAWFEEEEDKTKWLIKYSQKKYSIVLRASGIQIQGIVANLDYSLLRVIQYKGNNIYKVRNPWAQFEWNGDYGEKSSRWTPQLRKICQQKNGNDGVFFLSEKQLLKAFEYYSVGLDEPNSKYSFVEFESNPDQSLYFKFKLSKKGSAAIKITQPLDSLQGDQEYKYSPVVFELGKIQGKSVVFLSQGGNLCSFGAKSIYITDDLLDQYEPGEYFVRIKMNWVNPSQYNSAVLSVYCGECVTIERVKEVQGFKLWKKMIYSFMQDKQLTELDENIAYGMQWMKGQLICYASLNPKSKPKNYRVTWNFDQTNFVNCKLSLHRIKDNRIEFDIDKNEKFNIGTADSFELSEESDVGLVQLQCQEI